MRLFSFETFFNRVVDSTWYAAFIEPVLASIRSQGSDLRVLDVGTGVGKLPEFLLRSGRYRCTGIDINARMLAYARVRLAGQPVDLHQITPEQPFPVADASQDIVCFCSVLFLVPAPRPLLDEALRVLKPGGKILVLTPTGQVPLHRSVRLFFSFPFHFFNWSFFVWRRATAKRARAWAQKDPLPPFCRDSRLHYSKTTVLQGHAILEQLTSA